MAGFNYFSESGLSHLVEVIFEKVKDRIDAIIIPKSLSELSEDESHMTVTESEKNIWNKKSDFSGDYSDIIGAPDASEFVKSVVLWYYLSSSSETLTDGKWFDETYNHIDESDGILTDENGSEIINEDFVVTGKYLWKKAVTTFKDGSTFESHAVCVSKYFDHVTKSELDEVLSQLDDIDLSKYVTIDELASRNYLTAVPDEFVTESELVQKGYLTDIPEEYVTEAKLSNKGYLTKIPDTYITEQKLEEKGFITFIPDIYVTDSELESKGYLKDIPDYYITESELAKMGFITSIPDNYITESVLDSKQYITESALSGKGYLTDIPDEYVTDDELANKGFLSSIPDIYAKSEDIKKWVKDQGYSTESGGNVNVYIGPEQPENPEENILWVDTDEEVETGGNVDLSEYVTKADMSDAISKIELTPGPKGEPGYTPVKGVDYFDGAKGDPGYTPIKGVDYFDGIKGDPGYTPVKGVDYFDGAKGDPGYTPIKGKDYFDGQKGDPGNPGYTPVRGTDYWTDSDRAAIINDIMNRLPTMYSSNAAPANSLGKDNDVYLKY